MLDVVQPFCRDDSSETGGQEQRHGASEWQLLTSYSSYPTNNRGPAIFAQLRNVTRPGVNNSDPSPWLKTAVI
jgi:hypothetical protein